MAFEPPEEQDDESLALRVAADDDRAAAAVLVARYAPKLKGYLTKNFGSTLKSHGIEDAVQGAFLRMLKYIPSYKRHVARFEAWMIRLAHNVALDLIAEKDEQTFETFADDPVFFAEDAPDCEEPETTRKKDWRVQFLDDFIETKLSGFEQAVARAYVATAGNIDGARLIVEWGKTRNHFNVAKSIVKKKFREALAAAEKQHARERGKV